MNNQQMGLLAAAGVACSLTVAQGAVVEYSGQSGTVNYSGEGFQEIDAFEDYWGMTLAGFPSLFNEGAFGTLESVTLSYTVTINYTVDGDPWDGALLLQSNFGNIGYNSNGNVHGYIGTMSGSDSWSGADDGVFYSGVLETTFSKTYGPGSDAIEDDNFLLSDSGSSMTMWVDGGVSISGEGLYYLEMSAQGSYSVAYSYAAVPAPGGFAVLACAGIAGRRRRRR